MSPEATSPIKIDTVLDFGIAIEKILLNYFSMSPDVSVKDYIQCFSDEFLQLTCPEALHLPAACIFDEKSDELFIGIHISFPMVQAVSSRSHILDLFQDTEGVNAFLALAEEISHFHNILRQVDINSKISRFDLELQAEVDKIIIGSIVLKESIGKTHMHELITLLFDKSICSGTLTNYKLASKIAEKFLKDNIGQHGPNVIFDSRFRNLVQNAAKNHGDDKIQILSKKVSAA